MDFFGYVRPHLPTSDSVSCSSSMQSAQIGMAIHHSRFLQERLPKVLEAEHDTMLNRVNLKLNGPHVFPLLAHLPISSMLSCPHFTQCISYINGAVKTVRWGMTQYIGWWGRYQFENRKMSVNLKLNGPVSLHILLIFLFPMMLYSHHSWHVPRIVASSQDTSYQRWPKILED